MMLAAVALAATALPTTPAGWRDAALADAAAFHEDILANHPGAVNAQDRDFRRREAAAYAELRARAARVRDLTGYRYAIKGYVARFDDGHVQSWLDDTASLPAARWPGFLTGFDGRGEQVVMTRGDDAAVAMGERLVACDGVPAATLAARNVGAFEGRWSMASTRARRGGLVFVDRGNPFVARATRCTFAGRGGPHRVSLTWRPIADDELTQRSAATSGITGVPIGAQTLADGTRWYAMSSFDADPKGATAKALEPMLAGIERDRAALANAPATVLDLRGNGGGSSEWSLRVAKLLWGDARVAQVEAGEDGSYVEWRASPVIAAALDEYVTQFAGNAPIVAYFHTLSAGVHDAVERGQPLWREPAEASAAFTASAATGTAAPPSLRGPVYVVTDPGCGSACLDAVDLWRKLGAIQVGRETSGDTLYMEVREAVLPSGVTHIGVPMKVYRGRTRGSNETWQPVHAFTGDLTDTPALERWIATLPERQR